MLYEVITFLAAVQLTLYAGGIVVLIIFSILLTHHISHKFERPALFNLIGGAAVAIIGAGTVLFTVLRITSYNVCYTKLLRDKSLSMPFSIAIN